MNEGLTVHEAIYNLGDPGLLTTGAHSPGQYTMTPVTIDLVVEVGQLVVVEELKFHWTMTLTQFWAWVKQRIGRVRR